MRVRCSPQRVVLARRSRVLSLAASLAMSGCAVLRPALGLCLDSVPTSLRAQERAAREYTDASFAQALAAQGLVLVEPPWDEVEGHAFAGEPPGVFSYHFPELNPPGPESAPAFARDAQGVVHLVVREVEWESRTLHEQCACQPGYDQGLTPGERVRLYRVGALGPEVTVRYRARVVLFPRPACPRRGPPKA